MIRIEFYKLINFNRLHNELNIRFSALLTSDDRDKRSLGQTQALEFMRDNGFAIDNDMKWVTWEDDKDYTVSLLKWA